MARPLRALAALALALPPAVALAPSASAQIVTAPPRGIVGPGAGDSNIGGPGDRGTPATTRSAGWTRWWAFNREPYLARWRAPFALPVTAAELGGAALATNPARPSAEAVHLEVVPQLTRLLTKSRDLDVQAACLIALGKIGEPPADLAAEHDLPPVADAMKPFLRASNERVQDIALLSLGLLQDAAHAPLLADVALDRKEGRKAIRGARLDLRSRAFATYGLGFIGTTTTRRGERAFVVHDLQVLLDEQRNQADLATAAVIALGWCPLPFEEPTGDDEGPRGRERTIELLFEVLDDPKADVRARAQVPVAIARLIVAPDEPVTEATSTAANQARDTLRVRAVERFTAGIDDRTRDRNASVREGCVQALGLLVLDRPSGVDKTATDTLLALVEGGQEAEGGLALVALGRLIGRGSGEPGSRTKELRRAVSETAAKGSAVRRPWALLAIGISEDRGRAAGAAPALGTLSLVEARQVDAPVAGERAAAAIALGLAGLESAADAIGEGLGQGDFELRGLRAIALALMDARAWVPTMRTIVSENVYRPYLLRDMATALALMGDRQLVDRLVFKLAQARFIPERIEAVLALGWSDDPNAVPSLMFVLTEKRLGRKSIDDVSRAFAASALGTICGRPALPWNTRFALDVTWTAAPPSLTDRRNGGGVLDIL